MGGGVADAGGTQTVPGGMGVTDMWVLAWALRAGGWAVFGGFCPLCEMETQSGQRRG